MRPLIEPYGLAEAVRAGDLLYIAGQTGMDETHQIVDGGLKAQAAQAFRNIRAVLEAAGGKPENLVSLTWYVVEGPARAASWRTRWRSPRRATRCSPAWSPARPRCA